MSSATTIVLHLDDYTRLQQNNNNGYVLPETVLSAIRVLCSEIGYDETLTKDTYINQHNAKSESTSANSSSKQVKSKDREYRAHPKTKQDTWKTKTEFKATKFAVLDNVGEIINEIRILMNKLNESNKETKIAEIVEKLKDLMDECDEDNLEENTKKVFTIIYDIAMSSSIMPELYAQIISTIYGEYTSSFRDFLASQIDKYINSFLNIVDIDPNQDYDGFCALMTQTNYRKKTSSVFCEIAKLDKIDILNLDIVSGLVRQLIVRVVESIELKERQKEVEEITESLVIYFASLGEKAASLKAENLATFNAISTYKTSDKPGLNSRTKFKYMDLIGK